MCYYGGSAGQKVDFKYLVDRRGCRIDRIGKLKIHKDVYYAVRIVVLENVCDPFDKIRTGGSGKRWCQLGRVGIAILLLAIGKRAFSQLNLCQECLRAVWTAVGVEIELVYGQCLRAVRSVAVGKGPRRL